MACAGGLCLQSRNGNHPGGQENLKILLPLGPCPTLDVAYGLQVEGKRYPLVEDGIQVVVIDGRHGHVASQASFRNAILQGIPRQLFNYMAAIPDK